MDVPRRPAPAEEAALRAIVLGNQALLRVLRHVRDVGLPQAAVGAGAVRDVVFDALSGHPGVTRFRDVDVVYFDDRERSPERERRVEQELHRRSPEHRWDVKNQAAVHHWYEQRFGLPVDPLPSLEAAVATWPETATAVAVRLGPGDRLAVLAPLGLEDLLGMVWRHNATRATREVFERRLAEKRPQERWPRLRVVT